MLQKSEVSRESHFTSASFSLPAAAYYLPRHLAPSPTYPHLYPPYLIRGYPDTAAMENRQTIINDYITSQQMHHNAAATAMAQRADMLRGLSPREPSLALNYAAGPPGTAPSGGLGAFWDEEAGSGQHHQLQRWGQGPSQQHGVTQQCRNLAGQHVGQRWGGSLMLGLPSLVT